MKRREFVRKASAGAAAGALLTGCGSPTGEQGAAAVQTRPRVSWRLASSFSRSLDTIFGAAGVMADRVSELTDGRFTIRVFPAGELVPYDQVLESVQKGTVAMGHTASYYYIGISEALAFDCTVPFGMTARQLNAWLYFGDGLELMRSMFADFNIINFPGGNTGVQMGGWFRKEINSLTDLRGLKMRIPGLGGKVMDEMGVTVQSLASGEIYQALERGTIDATEWTGPYDDEKLGLHRAANNYYYPGWWEPGPGLSFYVNKGEYDGLPSDYQAALASASAEANVTMVARYDQNNPAALARLVDAGVALRPFPDDVMREAKRIALELQQATAEGDATYRRIYEAYTSWQSLSDKWIGTAEQTLARFAFE